VNKHRSILDKLQTLKWVTQEAYSNTNAGKESKRIFDDKKYIQQLITDVQVNSIKQLCKEDWLQCNSLWRKYDGALYEETE
jgi:hypothetical protein